MKNETVSNAWEIFSEFNEFPLFNFFEISIENSLQHIIIIIITNDNMRRDRLFEHRKIVGSLIYKYIDIVTAF